MLAKIIESYKYANTFCTVMHDYEKNKVFYNQAIEQKEFSELESWTNTAREEFNAALITGSLAYFITHPKKMITAQKYYSSTFGKPCQVK